MAKLPSDMIRAELDRLLASPILVRSEQRTRFLRYLVEQSLLGKHGTLKESVIGVEVFGRPPGWDPQADAIVRVQASRLRDKLREYYSTTGESDPVVIDIPRGGYVPRFRAKTRNAWYRRKLILAAACLTVFLGSTLWWALHPGRGIRSVAVLPLRNLDGNPSSEPLADGLTEDLIRYLAGLPGIRVVSPTSSFALKRNKKSLREIGSLLDVEGVVEGSLLWDGERVKLQAQLTRVSDQRVLWAGAFEREPRGLFSVQEELASAVSHTLRPTLERSILASSGMDPESYQLYLQGLAAYRLWTGDGLRRAIRYFEQAAEKDPRSARPWTALARAYHRLGQNQDRRAAGAKLRSAVRRALETDARSAEAHALQATVYWSLDANFPAAEAEFRHARGLSENSVELWAWYAWFLADRNRTAEAVEAQRRGVRLDPLAPDAGHWLATMYYFDRRYQEAISQDRRVLERSPQFGIAYNLIGRSYLAMGRCTEAIVAFRQRGEIPAEARARCGDRQGAVEALPRMEEAARAGRGNPREVAHVYAALGDKQRALDWLEFAERDGWWQHGLFNADWDPLRSEPRFQALRQRFGM